VAVVAESVEGLAAMMAAEMAVMPTTEMPTTTDVPTAVAAMSTTMTTTGEGDGRLGDRERDAKNNRPKWCALHVAPPSPRQG